MSIISTKQLTKRYGSRIGIDGIDLSVPEGSIFGFLGPNGAGKTTTIRVLLGFLRPTSGRAAVLGMDCWSRSRRIKQDVGYLPSDLRLYRWMTARNALSAVGRIRGRDLTKTGRALAERFRLEMDVKVRKMSRGMRQKLGLILTLAHRPQVLVLDEPTSGLDPLMQDVLGETLREMAKEGHTVFFSSHTLSEVEQLCDAVAILRRGRVVANETLQSLRDRAHRNATLVFADARAASTAVPPPCLERVKRDGKGWTAQLDGPAAPLVQWAAVQLVADLTISPPDLEDLFREYYRGEEEHET